MPSDAPDRSLGERIRRRAVLSLHRWLVRVGLLKTLGSSREGRERTPLPDCDGCGAPVCEGDCIQSTPLGPRYYHEEGCCPRCNIGGNDR